MMDAHVDALEVGQMYEVKMRYSASGRLIERTMVAEFLGVGNYKEVQFNLRPAAGTQSVPREWIIACMPTDLPARIPYKA